MGVTQYIRILKKLITRMDALGLGDIQIIGPSVGTMSLGRDTWMPAMLLTLKLWERSNILAFIVIMGIHLE